MNRITLLQLLKNRVDAVNKADEALTKLDDFCQKQWGMKFHDMDVETDQGDHIVEWLNYGNAEPDIDAFIKFMDKISCKSKEAE